MKLPYAEGSWFAIPLRTNGFGVGLVARATRQGRVILVYLFGPRRDAVPKLVEVSKYEPSSAMKIVRIGDLKLIQGSWPIIGQSPHWDRDLWPTPMFVRSDELSHRAWTVVYSDDDPNHVVREDPVPFNTSKLERDSVLGAGGVEVIMTKLLSAPVA